MYERVLAMTLYGEVIKSFIFLDVGHKRLFLKKMDCCHSGLDCCFRNHEPMLFFWVRTPEKHGSVNFADSWSVIQVKGGILPDADEKAIHLFAWDDEAIEFLLKKQCEPHQFNQFYGMWNGLQPLQHFWIDRPLLINSPESLEKAIDETRSLSTLHSNRLFG